MEYHSVDAQYYYSSHPYASIVYVNATGLEDTWTYHSQSVGRAGTISVNDYNGNLVLTHGDVSIASGVMPITLNHVFNTHDKDTDRSACKATPQGRGALPQCPRQTHRSKPKCQAGIQ